MSWALCYRCYQIPCQCSTGPAEGGPNFRLTPPAPTGCICPPTSEQTCRNDTCPRKSMAEKVLGTPPTKPNRADLARVYAEALEAAVGAAYDIGDKSIDNPAAFRITERVVAAIRALPNPYLTEGEQP